MTLPLQVEDRFVTEAKKRTQTPSAQASVPARFPVSEARTAFEWPDPSKSKDADTRNRAPNFAVPPVPEYDKRAILDPNAIAGIKRVSTDPPLNVLRWDIVDPQTKAVNAATFPETTYRSVHGKPPKLGPGK